MLKESFRAPLSSAELEEHDKEAVDAIQNIKRSEVDSCSDEETDFEMQTLKSKRRRNSLDCWLWF